MNTEIQKNQIFQKIKLADSTSEIFYPQYITQSCILFRLLSLGWMVAKLCGIDKIQNALINCNRFLRTQFFKY